MRECSVMIQGGVAEGVKGDDLRVGGCRIMMQGWRGGCGEGEMPVCSAELL